MPSGERPDHGAATVDAYRSLVNDVAAEAAELDGLVATIDDHAWTTGTLAEGWDVRDQIAHLALSEELGALAATDEVAFGTRLEELLARIATHPDGTGAALVGRGRELTGPQVLAWWRDGRDRTVSALHEHDPRDRLPWFAGPMSAMSFATARIMETWAHGQDIADALGAERRATARLRHIADLGVRARRYAYTARGREAPDAEIRVELGGPDGEQWAWGRSQTDFVCGTALDFCLVATQRRNPADTALDVTGPLAREWIDIAQAFAGPATDHRPPTV